MSCSLADDEFPNKLSSVNDRLNHDQDQRNNLWRSNYHEASIFIEEGLNNDKFENHPRKRAYLESTRFKNPPPPSTPETSPTSKPFITVKQHADQARDDGKIQKSQGTNGYLLGQYTTIETYIVVHNRYFYQLDLTASLILLLLALVESPAIDGYNLSPTIHSAIETLALSIIAVELILKFRWMGPSRFFRHGRTVVKMIVLIAMIVEAITIFFRHSAHARFSRALRPIFLVDNHYCHGIRRAIRQIFQSLPPIIDMFTLSLFFMFVFSIFGYYLLAGSNPHFQDMPATVGNLLILATTANLPDIIMPSYAVSRWSAIFFVLFLIVFLFLITNLTMAAVYESFTRKEKEKFHKLLLHRRKACQEAFKLLVSQRQPDRIHFRQFMGLMRYLNRKCSMFDGYLIFKALDTDKSGSISLGEFYQIYDHINLNWKLIQPDVKWFDLHDWIPKSLKRILAFMSKVVLHRYFEWFIDSLIALAAFLQFAEAAAQQSMPLPFKILRPDWISTSILLSLFAAEAAIKCLVIGISEYWEIRWNRFDMLVLCLSLGGVVSGYIGNSPFGWVIVMRVLRIMRLFEFKRRYRDIWQTLIYILLKRFVSMTCVVMILYYFFAIIGMEILGSYDLRNCCKNTTIESLFKYDNTTDTAGYYLNDFGDLVSSYMTLFGMTSSTYWLATMTAYSIVSQNDWVRVFFGFYYLCSIIVMNIVIAFILESFLFRIHYKNKLGNDCDDANLFTVKVALSRSEVESIKRNLSAYEDKNLRKLIDILDRKIPPFNIELDAIDHEEKASLLSKSPEILLSNSNYVYQAEQIRNKFSFTMKMYADEVETWLAEAERQDEPTSDTTLTYHMGRSQARTQHVAIARLVRRSITATDELSGRPRVRSYSSGEGLFAELRSSARRKDDELDAGQGTSKD